MVGFWVFLEVRPRGFTVELEEGYETTTEMKNDTKISGCSNRKLEFSFLKLEKKPDKWVFLKGNEELGFETSNASQ